MNAIHAAGKRKTAIARASLVPGAGVVRVNSQLLSSLPKTMFRDKIEEPLQLAGDAAKKVNIGVFVKGGGVNSQAEAARLAIAKALASFDKSLRQVYLEYDRAFTVADVRFKETHKPNRHGKARAKTQKSYR
ncbi:30S ribosomal protein S9 [Candidatus Woesearchaeota archaeon CG10_big_fil_rev_8_21_14_0_10_37_12]|nr:MAG: 30S ribosomal protein S9 [Candidatus Woesearchaeota archaeon CG10_big_fil_rev_8_21_14_0_10_37_12]